MGLGALQPGHLIVILVIVLLIFGPGKLPELGKAMGDGLRELKKATGGEEHKDAGTVAATTVAPPAVTAGVNASNSPKPQRWLMRLELHRAGVQLQPRALNTLDAFPAYHRHTLGRDPCTRRTTIRSG